MRITKGKYMGKIPFLQTFNIALGAGGAGALIFQTGLSEVHQIKRFWFISTGIFSLVGLRDSMGQQYTNASGANPIPSLILAVPGVSDAGVSNLLSELEFGPNVTLTFDIIDTSGAPNAVVLVCEGTKTLTS
jgi:hypothetical protein